MKKVVLIVATSLVLAVLLAVPALAATPQDIYNDYASGQTLHGPYTLVELQAYLNDATIHQYGDQAVLSALDVLTRAVVKYMEQGMTFEEALKKAREGHHEFPFTGMNTAALLVGALAVAGAGFVLRRRTA